MEYEYQIIDGTVLLSRIYGEGERIAIPEEIEGYPVTKLDAYIFSSSRRVPDAKKAICGTQVKEVILPSGLKEIGAYAFYGCRNLEKLTLHHSIDGFAGGAFTGCHFIKEICVYMDDQKGYCLKSLLGELRYEMHVTLIYSDQTRVDLLFPEYYEEDVENTPARNIDMNFLGSGYAYRQCFRDGILQYSEYDKQFPEAQFLESEDFNIELCLLRLMNPYELSETAKGIYISWLIEHRMSAGTWCITFEQEERLEYLSTIIEWNAQELEDLIAFANKENKLQLQSFLLDHKHKRFAGKRRSFVL